MQALVARSTPPSGEQEAVTALVTATAADLRPGAARATPSPGPDPPPRALPERSFEFQGKKSYDDPNGALAKLLAALEKHDRGEA